MAASELLRRPLRWATVNPDPRLQLLRSLPPAPMDGELEDPALTFGLAGMMSGVSFHTHGAVFAEVVLGCLAAARVHAVV